LPPISVLLPIRNGINYFERAKLSLLKNCSSLDEILIVDDGSSDGSSRLISDWEKQDSRVKVVQGYGRGLVNALNTGLNLTTNDWVARVDIDDTYASNRLKTQRELISDEIVAIFSDYRIIGSEGKNLGVITSAVFPEAVSVSLISSQRTAHPSVLIRKEAVISVGGYRIEDFPAEDLSLWFRLSRIGKLISSPSVLLNYQLNPRSISATKENEMNIKRNQLISEIGVQRSDLLSVKENWQFIIDAYDKLDFPAQRKILLLRDFYLASKLDKHGLNFNKYLIPFALKISADLRTYPEVAKLSSEKRKRKKQRLINYKPISFA